MTYANRLLVLVIASPILTALYFVFIMPWILLNISYFGGFLLPTIVILVGGSIYLAGRRRTASGKIVGYTRIILMAALTAFLSNTLAWILIMILGPSLHLQRV
jgi:hypothetical protein